jgi:hypothetical protein
MGFPFVCSIIFCAANSSALPSNQSDQQQNNPQIATALGFDSEKSIPYIFIAVRSFLI